MEGSWERYDYFVHELLVIAGVLEKQRFSFKTIDRLPRNYTVKIVVANLTEKFKDKLPPENDDE